MSKDKPPKSEVGKKYKFNDLRMFVNGTEIKPVPSDVVNLVIEPCKHVDDKGKR